MSLCYKLSIFLPSFVSNCDCFCEERNCFSFRVGNLKAPKGLIWDGFANSYLKLGFSFGTRGLWYVLTNRDGKILYVK